MKYILSVLFVFISIGGAAANLSARPIIVELTADGPGRADILIGNTGQRTQYLNITPLKITNLGAAPERYLDSPDPAEVGLLVAPRRLALQPAEEKIIRVILLEEEVLSDAAWRVRIEPAIGEIRASEPVAVTSIGYDALVFARPPDATTKVTGTWDGDALVLHNAGNTNALLHSGELCGPDAPCDEVAGKRLWPGMTWTIALPRSGTVSFVERGPGEDRTLVF